MKVVILSKQLISQWLFCYLFDIISIEQLNHETLLSHLTKIALDKRYLKQTIELFG